MSSPKSGNTYDTLRWADGTLEMLDQRALPVKVDYLRYDSAAAVAEGIKTMVVRGAPAIGCAAAYGVALEALRLVQKPRAVFMDGIEQGMALLAESRPTAVNLFWALNRMRERLKAFHDEATAKVADTLLAEAHAIAEEDVRLNRAMGAHGAALLADNMRILTHCNAGALATAGHGTALGIIRSAVHSGKRIQVFADETRPFLQGARLTAWELQQDEIPVILIADNAAGLLMRLGEIDAVIVGADRVAANGDVANKIGTYSVAVLARRHGIPFYVAAPLSTIDPGMLSGGNIPIEERAASEITGYGNMQWAPCGVAVRNPVFDITPAELVTALVTERGVVFAPDQAKMRTLIESPAPAK